MEDLEFVLSGIIYVHKTIKGNRLLELQVEILTKLRPEHNPFRCAENENIFAVLSLYCRLLSIFPLPSKNSKIIRLHEVSDKIIWKISNVGLG